MKHQTAENPFVYGKVVKGKYFFDRLQEKKRLIQLMKGKNNILITGDRRIGKTSLILECFSELERQGIALFYLNMDPISSVASFVERYGDLFTKKVPLAKRALQILKSGLKGFKIDIEIDDNGSPIASINWQGPGLVKPKVIQDILNLPDVLAKKNKQRFIVCFDEFQLARDIKGVNLIAEMRADFQLHDNITYIFMGSETKILDQLFSSPNEKFFNSSIKFHLGPIPREDFIGFMKKKFAVRGISVSGEVGEAICDWANNIPAHTQHLCACLWDHIQHTSREITKASIQQAIQAEIESNDQLYLQIWQTLGDPKDQIILRRLAEAKHLAVSSPEFCSPLGMNPATVTRRLHKIATRTRGAIIHQRSGVYTFSDPFFKDWIFQKT